MKIYVIIKSSSFDFDEVTNIEGAFKSKEAAEDRFQELVKVAIADFHQAEAVPTDTRELEHYFWITDKDSKTFVELLLKEAELN